jgi:hypothetical protein
MAAKLKNLAGQRFGRWTVLSRAPNGDDGKVRWNCICDCDLGTRREVRGVVLTSGQSKSCGCWASEVTSRTKLKDLSGRRFGRLSVECRVENKHGEVRWRCWCGCLNPNPVIVTRSHLLGGNTQSCGCWQRESAAQRATKHGHASGKVVSPEYRSLSGAINRCFNPRNKDYLDYGGRLNPPMSDRYRFGPDGKTGIGIEALVADIGVRPKGYTLGRINNDLGYVVGNVEWQTWEEQENNRRDNHYIPMPDGRVVTRSQLSCMLGFSRHKLTDIIGNTKASISRGTTTSAEQGTKLGIQLIFWLLLAGILKGPDDHHATVRSVLGHLRSDVRGSR